MTKTRQIQLFLTFVGIFLNISIAFSQDGWRVAKIKEDSIELNKLVTTLVSKEKNSSEWLFLFDNIKSKYPNFAKTIGKDTDNETTLSLLHIMNEKYEFATHKQKSRDNILKLQMELKDYYLEQGYNISQANALILEKTIVPNCLKNNTPKDCVECVSVDLRQYLEELKLFTSTEIELLVSQMGNQLLTELNAKQPIKKSATSSIKKKN